MKQIVYDKDGKPYERDSVDCREYLATGRYFTEPPAKKAAPKKEVLPHPFVEAETKPKKAAAKK